MIDEPIETAPERTPVKNIVSYTTLPYTPDFYHLLDAAEDFSPEQLAEIENILQQKKQESASAAIDIELLLKNGFGIDIEQAPNSKPHVSFKDILGNRLPLYWRQRPGISDGTLEHIELDNLNRVDTGSQLQLTCITDSDIYPPGNALLTAALYSQVDLSKNTEAIQATMREWLTRLYIINVANEVIHTMSAALINPDSAEETRKALATFEASVKELTRASEYYTYRGHVCKPGMDKGWKEKFPVGIGDRTQVHSSFGNLLGDSVLLSINQINEKRVFVKNNQLMPSFQPSQVLYYGYDLEVHKVGQNSGENDIESAPVYDKQVPSWEEKITPVVATLLKKFFPEDEANQKASLLISGRVDTPVSAGVASYLKKALQEDVTNIIGNLKGRYAKDILIHVIDKITSFENFAGAVDFTDVKNQCIQEVARSKGKERSGQLFWSIIAGTIVFTTFNELGDRVEIHPQLRKVRPGTYEVILPGGQREDITTANSAAHRALDQYIMNQKEDLNTNRADLLSINGQQKSGITGAMQGNTDRLAGNEQSIHLKNIEDFRILDRKSQEEQHGILSEVAVNYALYREIMDRLRILEQGTDKDTFIMLRKIRQTLAIERQSQAVDIKDQLTQPAVKQVFINLMRERMLEQSKKKFPSPEELTAIAHLTVLDKLIQKTRDTALAVETVPDESFKSLGIKDAAKIADLRKMLLEKALSLESVPDTYKLESLLIELVLSS